MKTPNIDFVGKRKIFFSISIAIIAITIICAFILGVNVDIKFKGGTILTYPWDVYKRQIQLNTMFVDEGFGSLDSDALRQAIHCFTQLNQGHRMVGIISHVPELREQIANQFVVEKLSLIHI